MGKGRQKQGTLQLFMRVSITLIGKPDKESKLKENGIYSLLMNVGAKTGKQNISQI